MRKSPKPKTTPQNETKFSLRVPDNTYETIRRVAEFEQRSINSQVVRILQQWIADNPDLIKRTVTTDNQP